MYAASGWTGLPSAGVMTMKHPRPASLSAQYLRWCASIRPSPSPAATTTPAY